MGAPAEKCSIHWGDWSVLTISSSQWAYEKNGTTRTYAWPAVTVNYARARSRMAREHWRTWSWAGDGRQCLPGGKVRTRIRTCQTRQALMADIGGVLQCTQYVTRGKAVTQGAPPVREPVRVGIWNVPLRVRNRRRASDAFAVELDCRVSVCRCALSIWISLVRWLALGQAYNRRISMSLSFSYTVLKINYFHM